MKELTSLQKQVADSLQQFAPKVAAAVQALELEGIEPTYSHVAVRLGVPRATLKNRCTSARALGVAMPVLLDRPTRKQQEAK